MRTYELEVAGYHFRVEATPTSRQVDWLDCPSQYLPSGFSSAAYIAAGPSDSSAPPMPTEDELRDQIDGWLEGLAQDEEYQGEFSYPSTW